MAAVFTDISAPLVATFNIPMGYNGAEVIALLHDTPNLLVKKFAAGAWTTPSAVSPSDRGGMTMAYDGTDLMVYGGNHPSGSPLYSATWRWDGTDWNNLSPTHDVGIRSDYSMCWDGTNVILFGGATDLSFPATTVDETWQWDGTDWTQLTPATPPPARYLHKMAFHDGRIILFGGDTGDGTLLADTWAFEAGEWTELAPADSPSARVQTNMAYDGASILVFGGTDNIVYLNDTWAWDNANETWVECTVASPPSVRSDAGITTESGRAILQGGRDGGGSVSDTTTYAITGTCVTVAPDVLTAAISHTFGLS